MFNFYRSICFSDMDNGHFLYMQVLLLMATALNVPRHELPTDGVQETLTHKLRTRHQYIAEVTEMIHVSFLSSVLSYHTVICATSLYWSHALMSKNLFCSEF